MTVQEITEEVVLNSFMKTVNPKDDVEKKCFEIVKQALEKQIPKKPIEKELYNIPYYICPVCHSRLMDKQFYCDECGQKIDLEEGEISD